MPKLSAPIILLSGISISLSAYSLYLSNINKVTVNEIKDSVRDFDLKVKIIDEKYSEVTDYYLGISQTLQSTESFIKSVLDLYEDASMDLSAIRSITDNLDILDELNSNAIFAKFEKQEIIARKNKACIETLREKLSNVMGAHVEFEELKIVSKTS